MATAEKFRVKVLGPGDVIDTLKADVGAIPKGITVTSSGKEQDPSYLEFGLADVATIITVITGVIAMGEFSAKVYKAVKGTGKRVTIMTPYRRVDVVDSKNLTEQEVEQIVRDATSTIVR